MVSSEEMIYKKNLWIYKKNCFDMSIKKKLKTLIVNDSKI